MKKIIPIISLLLIAVFCVSSCTNPTPKPPENAGFVLEAFEGEYDAEKHIEAIEKYVKSNNPKKITRGEKITIPLDRTPKGADIDRIAEASNEGAIEQTLIINIDVPYEVDKKNNQIIIDTEWWYDGSDYLLNEGLWTFLVSVTMQNGKTVWYYLRVDFVPVEGQ